MGPIGGHRAHKVILNEFYQVAFRIKIYRSLEALQADIDAWMDIHNHERMVPGQNVFWPHTPIATFEDGKGICRKKMIA